MRDASRFSRRDGDEAFSQLKAIARAGVQIWFYQDGTRFAYGNFADNITGLVRAEMNAEFRRQIAKWTKEAMLRKAKAGHVTGGRLFGYDNVRVDGHVERRVNEVEGAVVRRIFEMAASGAGFKRIAKTLNDEAVLCPRAQQGRRSAWSPSSVRPILFRTSYTGVVTWGKTRARGDDGERRQVRVPKDQWLTVDVPALRIVDDDLWRAAHRRIAASAAAYIRATNGRLYGRPALSHESKYLLTGFASCAACPDQTRPSGLMAHSIKSTSRGRLRLFTCAVGTTIAVRRSVRTDRDGADGSR